MRRETILLIGSFCIIAISASLYFQSKKKQIEPFDCWCRDDATGGNSAPKSTVSFSANGTASASIAANASMASGVPSVIDTASAYSATTGQFTTPITGKYFFYITLRSVDGNNGVIGGAWAVNGKNDGLQVFEYVDPNGRRMLSTHTIKNLNKGDVVQFSNITAYNLANQVDWGGYLIA